MICVLAISFCLFLSSRNEAKDFDGFVGTTIAVLKFVIKQFQWLNGGAN